MKPFGLSWTNVLFPQAGADLPVAPLREDITACLLIIYRGSLSLVYTMLNKAPLTAVRNVVHATLWDIL